MPAPDHNAVVDLARFGYIGRHFVKLAVANRMSALDNSFRITRRTLVVALAGVAAPSCAGCFGRLRSESKRAGSLNSHGCGSDQHSVEKIAARDGLVQTEQLVRVRMIGHRFFPLAAPQAGCMAGNTGPVPYFPSLTICFVLLRFRRDHIGSVSSCQGKTRVRCT